jgi:hypothetical protein
MTFFSFAHFSDIKMRKRAGVGAIQKKKADAEKFRTVSKDTCFVYLSIPVPYGMLVNWALPLRKMSVQFSRLNINSCHPFYIPSNLKTTRNMKLRGRLLYSVVDP